MSGSPGGGGSSFGGGGGAAFDCASVSIQTTIMSPDPIVLAGLSAGDVLNVSLRTATGPLIAVTASGDTLGVIFTTDLSTLIDCINNGYDYKATILRISGAECHILITNR